MKWEKSIEHHQFEFVARGRYLSYRISMQHGDSWVAIAYRPSGYIQTGDCFDAGKSEEAREWCEKYERSRKAAKPRSRPKRSSARPAAKASGARQTTGR
jgi:hypothetical protein